MGVLQQNLTITRNLTSPGIRLLMGGGRKAELEELGLPVGDTAGGGYVGGGLAWSGSAQAKGSIEVDGVDEVDEVD